MQSRFKTSIKTSISGFIFGTLVICSKLPFVLSPLYKQSYSYNYDRDHDQDQNHNRNRISSSKIVGLQDINGETDLRSKHSISRLEFIVVLYLVLVAGSSFVLWGLNLNSINTDNNNKNNININIKNDDVSGKLNIDDESAMKKMISKMRSKLSIKLNPRSPSGYNLFKYDGNIIGGLIQGIGMGILKSEPGVLFLVVGGGFYNLDDGIRGTNTGVLGGISNGMNTTAFRAMMGGIIGGFCFVLFDSSSIIKSMKSRLKRKAKYNDSKQKKIENRYGKVNEKEDGKAKPEAKDKREETETEPEPDQILTIPQYLGLSTHQFIKGYHSLLFIILSILLLRNGYKNSSFSSTSSPSNPQFITASTTSSITLTDAIRGGVYISLSQISSILLTKGTLGVSSFYPALATYVLRGMGRSDLDKPGMNSLFFASGVMISGFGARAMDLLGFGSSRSGLDSVPSFGSDLGSGSDFDLNVTSFRAIVGGMLMIFGARLAGGCTSGHGISGFGLMSISSFVTVLSMVGGVVLGCICV